MTPTYLDDIVAFHRQRAAADVRDWRERVDEAVRSHPSFADAVRTSTHSNVAVIAEVKRRSPSKGWINQGLDAGALAQAYAAGGASAISVLTDGPHFGGSLDDLATVRAAVALPMLRKDFTVSANDVIDAARAGASAVLLIVAALEDDELELFTSVAKRCGLDALVEVHDEREVARAVASGATIIGINQRNLRTFEVDPRHAASLVTRLPRDVLAVCESGLGSSDDVRAAAEAGFDAVLVGETFVRATVPTDVVRAFASVPRVPRA